MMNKTRYLYFFVIVAALLMTAAAPSPGQLAAKATSGEGLVKFTIVNHSDGSIFLKLDGSTAYYFVVGKNTTRAYTPQRGVYKYKLYACGLVTTDKINLTIVKILTIPECGGRIRDFSDIHQVDLSPAFRPIKLIVSNGNPRSVRVKLDGPRNYHLTVGGNTTASYGLVQGVYKYIVYICGTTVQGTLDLTVYKDLTIPVCGANAVGAADLHEENISLNKIVRSYITNQTTSLLVLRLEGPQNYSFLVQPHETKVLSLLRGSYSYEYFGCSATVKGTFNAKNNASLMLNCPD